MRENSVSKDKWNKLEEGVEKLVRDLDCNVSDDHIYVRTTDEGTYKSIEKIARKLRIISSIEIKKPVQDHMKGGYQIVIIRK